MFINPRYTRVLVAALTSACLSVFAPSESPKASLIGDEVSVWIKSLNAGHDLSGTITSAAEFLDAITLAGSGHQYSVGPFANGVSIP